MEVIQHEAAVIHINRRWRLGAASDIQARDPGQYQNHKGKMLSTLRNGACSVSLIVAAGL